METGEPVPMQAEKLHPSDVPDSCFIQAQPFQEALMTFRIFCFKKAMPLFHVRFLESDFPKQFNPLLDAYLSHLISILSLSCIPWPMVTEP
jgi:hypothetical protein